MAKNNKTDYFFTHHPKTNQQLFVKKVGLPEGSRELRALQEIQSNAIPHLVDFHVEEGSLVIAMQSIDGVTLDHYCEDNRKIGIESEMLVQLAHALDSIHKSLWLHRDIKPSNIIIDDMRRAYFVDFGTAVGLSDVGQIHRFEGTLAFLAPEAVFRPNTIDVRSDYYSLGKSLLHAIDRKIALIQPEILQLIYQLIEEKPENRPADIKEWASQVQKIHK